MSDSKWIEVSSSSAPATEVATEALRLRVKRVEKMLPLAAWEYQDDIEYVHQLRTSCRRAAAALQAFRPLMSAKPKALRKLLSKIRTAAGPARDADVLFARFDDDSPNDTNHSYVLARLQLQRAGAQDALVAIAEKSKSGKLRRSLDEVCQSLNNDAQIDRRSSFRQFGRDALFAASKKVFQLTAVKQPTLAQLHRLRIAGKRLRYSIELFFEAFPDEMRTEVYPLIGQLQDRLGRLNDHATAQSMFQYWLADLPAGERAAHLAGLIVGEYEAAQLLRRDFLEWWTTQQVAALESRLSSLVH